MRAAVTRGDGIPRNIAARLRWLQISPPVILIVMFWCCQFAFMTAQRTINGSGDTAEVLLPRATVSVIAMIISLGINYLHRRQEGRSWPHRLWVALGAALGGAILHAFANYWVFKIAIPYTPDRDMSIYFYFGSLVVWIWIYSAISALLLAGAYSDDLRERERRLAEWQALAHSAQMRALRYQLNPHFMFNTLNSIASLIAAGRPAPAEQMVENLSDFLRAGLALDPADDLTLERELELQSLYLSIEAIRFADRLHVEMDLPEELRDVCVPSLILQPIVENAVKHGVARSNDAISIRICVARVEDRVVLSVRNGVGDAVVKPGTGVGLANVARRLELRYGCACDFEAGLEGDTFVVRFSVPIQREE